MDQFFIIPLAYWFFNYTFVSLTLPISFFSCVWFINNPISGCDLKCASLGVHNLSVAVLVDLGFT